MHFLDMNTSQSWLHARCRMRTQAHWRLLRRNIPVSAKSGSLVVNIPYARPYPGAEAMPLCGRIQCMFVSFRSVLL